MLTVNPPFADHAWEFKVEIRTAERARKHPQSPSVAFAVPAQDLQFTKSSRAAPRDIGT